MEANLVISGIVDLGYSIEQANEMIDLFKKKGGLHCIGKWPNEFSFFSPRRNVLDVLLENDLL